MQFGQILTVSVADCFGADAHGMRQADHKRALSPACSWRLIFEGLQSFAVLPFTDLAPCDAAHVPSHPVSTCEACVRACLHACTLARTNTSTCVVIVLGHALETRRSVPKAQNMCEREQVRLRASEITCACSPADKIARTPCTHPRHGRPTKHTTASFPSQHGGNTHRRRHRKRPATPPPLPLCRHESPPRPPQLEHRGPHRHRHAPRPPSPRPSPQARRPTQQQDIQTRRPRCC